MELVGLIMAGGQGKRMEIAEEKPLALLGGKPMIKHVVEALESVEEVRKIVVATSPNTPRTAGLMDKLSLELLKTSGKGYHSDMKEAVKKIGQETVFVISADLPLVRTETLEKIIERFGKSSKSALSVFVDCKALDLDLNFDHQFEVGGKNVSPVGISVIKGEKISDPHTEQENMIISEPELALNVNNENRLRLAREILSSGGS